MGKAALESILAARLPRRRGCIAAFPAYIEPSLFPRAKSPMAPPLLQLKDIALTFGGTPLLAGAELSVSPGERVSLVGRNGSGKSTLLKIAASLVEPDRGSVFVQPGALVRYLPQEPDFSGFASTLAYVEAGLRPTDDAHTARYLLEQLGLTGQEDPAHLSGGEARRVALARVLAPAPGYSPARRADQSSRSHDHRMAGARSRCAPLRDGDHQPRPALSLDACRAARSGSTAARPAASSADLRISKNGATRCWRKRNATSTSSTARSSPKSIGCATASPAGANATCAGSASCRRCGNSAAPIAPAPAMPPSPPVRRRRPARWSSRPSASAKATTAAPIVSDFSTRIQRGDRIGIVGPNGSGKTTLINMLTGNPAAGHRRRCGWDRRLRSRRSISIATASTPMSRSRRR